MEKSNLSPHIRLAPTRPRSNRRWPVALGALVVVSALGVAANQIWFKPSTVENALRRGHYSVAMTLLQQTADKGDTGAQNSVGNLYALGLGVERDRVTAIDWYKKAAFAGSANARVNMGHLYNHAFTLSGPTDASTGINPNPTLSYAWFNLARNQGHPQAQMYMSELLWGHRQIHHLVNQIRRDYATIRNFRDTEPPDISP